MGPSSGLSMTVLVNNSHYMPSVSSELDVVLRVHESHVFPSMNLLNAFVQPRYRLKITMEPTTVVADEDIRKLPFERRGCCFPSEVHIKQFMVRNSTKILDCEKFYMIGSLKVLR